MRNTLGKLCVILATLMLLFSVGFFTVSLILKDGDMIEQKYKELDVSATMGMTTPDLARATTVLLDYMRGDRANIKVEARVFGEERELFNQPKEIVHMTEVQDLWLGLSAFAKYGAVAAAALLLIGFLLIERGARRAVLSSGLFWGCGIFGGVLAFLGVWAILDFDSFWTIFHFIIFPASLFQYLSAGGTAAAMSELNWMLDSDSIMVRMLMPIFPSLVMRCAICIILEIAFIALVAIFIRFAWRKPGKPSPVADVVVIERDANEPVPIKGPNLVLSHKLRNAPVAMREELLRRAKNGEPLEDEPRPRKKETEPIMPKPKEPAATEPDVTETVEPEAEAEPKTSEVEPAEEAEPEAPAGEPDGTEAQA